MHCREKIVNVYFTVACENDNGLTGHNRDNNPCGTWLLETIYPRFGGHEDHVFMTHKLRVIPVIQVKCFDYPVCVTCTYDHSCHGTDRRRCICAHNRSFTVGIYKRSPLGAAASVITMVLNLCSQTVLYLL